ncbi:MAG: hypothetical protein PXX77_02120 [Gallionella sp.]|nr:hypothetical protein [Gallionella sp.]
MGLKVGNLVENLSVLCGDPTKGLPEEVFVFASQITPLVNVDLLIKDDSKGVLLTWRDDGHYEAGWHVPGGIIRYKETLADRIAEVARLELGAKVFHEAEPMAINQVIHPTNKTRGHFISLLFACRLVSPPLDSLAAYAELQSGHWQWHKKCPVNLITVQDIYRSHF